MQKKLKRNMIKGKDQGATGRSCRRRRERESGAEGPENHLWTWGGGWGGGGQLEET